MTLRSVVNGTTGQELFLSDIVLTTWKFQTKAEVLFHCNISNYVTKLCKSTKYKPRVKLRVGNI